MKVIAELVIPENESRFSACDTGLVRCLRCKILYAEAVVLAISTDTAYWFDLIIKSVLQAYKVHSMKEVGTRKKTK